MLQISRNVSIPLDEIQFEAVRSQGAGGQNVNKVASAIQLRFDIRASTLPTFYKERLLALADSRITQDGVIVIKAQNERTQLRNREDALQRLQSLIREAGRPVKRRRPTKPTRASQKRRVERKKKRGALKRERRRKNFDE